MKKFIFYCRFLTGLIAVLVLALGREEASAANFVGFAFSAYTSTNGPFYTNSSITTVITVTNDTGLFLDTAYITNDFSAAVTFEEFTNYGTNSNGYVVGTNAVIVSGNTAVFEFENFSNTGVAQLTVTWQPQVTGLITNSISVGSPDVVYDTVNTNLVSFVYDGAADLGVNFAYVSQAYVTNLWVITNDWVTYTVAVTNLGTVTASGVMLTNTLPAGLKQIPPSNYPVVSNNVVFNVGTLSPGAGTQYQFYIQPTNEGVYTLAAVAGAPNLYSSSNAIDNGTAFLGVTNYLATLAVGTNSGQNLNFQDGLVEQTVQVTNTSGISAPGVRVVVTGLTNRLFNASGTNAGHPFVTGPASLAAGGNAGLRMQYFPRPASLPFPFTNGQLQAYAVPAVVLNYTPYAPVLYSTNLSISRILRQVDGDMLIEFPSTLSNSYTIVYSDNLQFSNAMIATPAYLAPGNRVQWLDYGPPATISAPTNASQRFYRVYLNP